MLQIYDLKTKKYVGVSYKEDKQEYRDFHFKNGQGAIWTTDNIVLSKKIVPKGEKKIGNKVIIVSPSLELITYKSVELLDLANEKINEINKSCKDEIIGGFKSNALGETHIYQSEEIDQLNLIGMVASNTDDVFKCKKTTANATWEYKTHTAEQLRTVLIDGKEIKKSLLIKASIFKNDIIKATTIGSILSINW